MNSKQGFSLIELLIAMAIISILLTIASYSWQRYTANTNLRTAARQITTDFSKYYARAISEGRTYTITFNTSLDSYNVSASLKAGNDDLTAVNITQMPIESDRIKDANITATDFTGCNIVRMTPRGLVEHCSVKPSSQNEPGSVTIMNSRGATATVNISERGGVYVTFSNL